MSLSFRSPAAGYFFEPGLREHIEESLQMIELIKKLEELPFGWDTTRVDVVQHGDKAVIVVPLEKEGEHLGDLILANLDETWPQTCCFPLPATLSAGEC